jgi:DNA-binding MarR family transcriptional regulator
VQRLADDLVDALLAASRALVGVSSASLAEVADSLTLTQFRTLVLLAEDPDCTLGHLAKRLGVNASTAQRQVDRLVSLRLVHRREAADDRRQVSLRLTAPAERLVERVLTTRRTAIATIVGRMPTAHQQLLIEALSDFATAAGEHRQVAAAAPGW